MKKLNVALVGCWHPHVPRYYPILQKREDTALTCVWDWELSARQRSGGLL